MKRFIALSIPGRGDEPAAWFVFDRETHRSVRRVSGGWTDARDAARAANRAWRKS